MKYVGWIFLAPSLAYILVGASTRKRERRRRAMDWAAFSKRLLKEVL